MINNYNQINNNPHLFFFINIYISSYSFEPLHLVEDGASWVVSLSRFNLKLKRWGLEKCYLLSQ